MIEFWKTYWQLIKPYKQGLLTALVWIGIVQILLLVDPYIFKLVLDEITNFNKNSVQTLTWLVIAFMIFGVVTTLISNKKFKAIFYAMLLMERDIPSRCMKKLMELSLGYHVSENTGAKMGKITRGAWRTTEVAATFLFDVAPILIETTLVFIVLLVLDLPIALIFIGVIPLFILQSKYIQKRITPLRLKRHDDYEKADHLMTQAVVNIPTVQSYAQEKREFKKYYNLKETIFGNERIEWFRLINFDYCRSATILTGQVLILIAGTYQVASGVISIGSLVLFLMLSNKVYNSLYKLSFIYERVADASESVNRLAGILNEPTEITSAPDAKQLKSMQGKIVFENVHFCYPKTNNGLHGVDLKIRPGETVGICGPSGGGKSTLARLVPRFYDVCSGAVKIDGHDVRDLNLSFRRHIGIVPQEVEIFDSTIAENIAYGNPKATIGEIRQAAAIAHVDEFVDELKSGYGTKVGERGLKLSGGQRQRIGIARAILTDPAVLIFDEATSHLDPISEQLIQESIKKLQGTRTIIIIAHRLSTIQDANRIVVLEGGVIAEEGTHRALMAAGGLYHELATRLATDSL